MKIQFLALLTVIICLSLKIKAYPQSAIYFDAGTGAYGFSYGSSFDEVNDKAKDDCYIGGGLYPEAIVTTKDKGFGAIATGFKGKNKVIGASAGKTSAKKAKKAAIKDCRNFGGKDIVVAESWNDDGSSSYPDYKIESILKDEFNDNSKNWFEGKTKDWNFKIKNGKYNIENFNDAGRCTSWPKIPDIHSNKDYSIETSLKRVSGSNDNDYGLMWGFLDNNRFMSYTINGNGHIKISSWFNQKESTYVDTVNVTDLKTNNGNVNILKITSSGINWIFYINGVYVATLAHIEMPGNGLGFILFRKQKVEIDNIHLYYFSKTK